MLVKRQSYLSDTPYSKDFAYALLINNPKTAYALVASPDEQSCYVFYLTKEETIFLGDVLCPFGNQLWYSDDFNSLVSLLHTSGQDFYDFYKLDDDAMVLGFSLEDARVFTDGGQSRAYWYSEGNNGYDLTESDFRQYRDPLKEILFTSEWTELISNSGAATLNGGTSKDTEGMIFPDSDCRVISEAEYKSLDYDHLRLAVQELYARHGFIFTPQDLTSYYGSLSWYHPDTYDMELCCSRMNDIEQINVDNMGAYLNNWKALGHRP